MRNHWSIENNLHWTLDIHFKDDHDYKREKNSAINFGIIKRMGLNLIKKEPSKGTINRVGRGRRDMRHQEVDNYLQTPVLTDFKHFRAAYLSCFYLSIT